MMYSDEGQQQPNANLPVRAQVNTQPAPPSEVSPEALAKAMQVVNRRNRRGKLARRGLLLAAGAGLCVGAVELGPKAIQQAGYYTEQDIKNALAAGVLQGRQALLAELEQLEGITLDGAIGIAELTRFGVDKIVVPLANLSISIGNNSLGILSSALSTARSNLGRVNVHVDWIDNLQGLVDTWRANLPDNATLTHYANADINGAESYLKALQAKIVAAQSGTPAPTATTSSAANK